MRKPENPSALAELADLFGVGFPLLIYPGIPLLLCIWGQPLWALLAAVFVCKPIVDAAG